MKISVCIATYNGAKYIAEQLDSILPQLSENDEVIISDDSSTDATIEIISNYNDSRIKTYPHQQFGNPIFNFEHAIKKASGDIIFLSDQDDKWEKNKISTMMPFFDIHDLVVSNARIGDASLKIVKESYFEWRNSRTGLIKNFYKNSYLGCCMAFKKNTLEKILPFPKNIPMHDMWIGMICEIHYKPIFIQDKLMVYRRHGGNATFLKDDYTSNETFKSKLGFRLRLFISVLSRSLKLS